MSDTVVTPGKTVSFLFSNFRCEPVQLDGGEVLGQLEPVIVRDTSPEADGPEGNNDSVVASEEMDVYSQPLSLDDVELPDTHLFHWY